MPGNTGVLLTNPGVIALLSRYCTASSATIPLSLKATSKQQEKELCEINYLSQRQRKPQYKNARRYLCQYLKPITQSKQLIAIVDCTQKTIGPIELFTTIHCCLLYSPTAI